MRLALIVLAALLALTLFGCTGKNGGTDIVKAAEALRDAGFEGRLTVIYGNGHLAGQSFNLTGSSGFLEVTIDPKRAVEP